MIKKTTIDEIIQINLKLNELLSFLLNRNKNEELLKFQVLQRRILKTLNQINNSKLNIEEKIYLYKSIKDSLSGNQVKSKFNIIDFVNQNNIYLGNVYFCCGWLGTFVIFFEEEKYKRIINIDKDKRIKKISEDINRDLIIKDWKYKHLVEDIINLNYVDDKLKLNRFDGTEIEINFSPDTIINTSCEHLNNFDDWINSIPKEKLLILQSNNNDSFEDHINISSSLEEFKKKIKLKKIIYENTIKLNDCERYTVIGYK
ncbi:MAG: hypothetical protein NZZ41_06140 [Candidatus Dojkabacteria bacterium]|nr:hypothetical protein [Candidatus Dojkabacteria bacterium]